MLIMAPIITSIKCRQGKNWIYITLTSLYSLMPKNQKEEYRQTKIRIYLVVPKKYSVLNFSIYHY